MLKRKIETYLADWKRSEDRKPLVIKGIRQCGKTYIVQKFARENYESVVYMNFILEPDNKSAFTGNIDVDTIILNLSALIQGSRFIEGKTCIILDEIQECKEARTALKSFHIDGRFDVIATGSLLGVKGYGQSKKKKEDVGQDSVPVGYETVIDMYPLDFEEFLWAKGYGEEQIDSIRKHMIDLKPFSETELNIYKSLFLDYCVLGGMPEVVRGYVETGTFSGSLETQEQIRLDYEEDVRKYAEGLDQAKIISVYRSVPAQLAKENKKFQFSKIEKNARSREYTGCIEWLIDAGVVTECNCLIFPELPLKGNIDESKYKLYYPDTGLLISALDEEAQEDLRVNKNLGVYKGALYENFVAEAFVKQGLGLFYYKKDNSTLEEDFFVRTRDELIPVEVKSNNDRSKSLTALIKNENYSDIKHGIKLGDFNVGYANGIYTFPYFCAFMMKAYLKSLD